MTEKNYDLDLDALEPEHRTVKLGGQLLEVIPPKFKNIVSLLKLTAHIQDGEGDQVELMTKLQDCLLPIVPALSAPDVDLTVEQMMKLFEFVMTTVEAAPSKEVEDAGLSLTQKKTIDQPQS